MAITATPAAPPVAVEAAPVIHQHLHLHGISVADVAALIRTDRPALEDRQR
ncbi:MAG: hypothetical protein WBH47_22180 [Streptosporangiaceae bacterium]